MSPQIECGECDDWSSLPISCAVPIHHTILCTSLESRKTLHRQSMAKLRFLRQVECECCSSQGKLTWHLTNDVTWTIWCLVAAQYIIRSRWNQSLLWGGYQLATCMLRRQYNSADNGRPKHTFKPKKNSVQSSRSSVYSLLLRTPTPCSMLLAGTSLVFDLLLTSKALIAMPAYIGLTVWRARR